MSTICRIADRLSRNNGGTLEAKGERRRRTSSDRSVQCPSGATHWTDVEHDFRPPRNRVVERLQAGSIRAMRTIARRQTRSDHAGSVSEIQCVPAHRLQDPALGFTRQDFAACSTHIRLRFSWRLLQLFQANKSGMVPARDTCVRGCTFSIHPRSSFSPCERSPGQPAITEVNRLS